jgi:hypothetical protein
MQALVKEKLEDCLMFEWPHYVSHDWDNIPPVVPRFIVQLTKYMEGVTTFVKAHEMTEKTANLRKDIEQRLVVVDTDHKKHCELTNK